jgi:hypothetical protein
VLAEGDLSWDPEHALRDSKSRGRAPSARALDPNPETRRGAQRHDATISANDKRVLAEGDLS